MKRTHVLVLSIVLFIFLPVSSTVLAQTDSLTDKAVTAIDKYQVQYMELKALILLEGERSRHAMNLSLFCCGVVLMTLLLTYSAAMNRAKRLATDTTRAEMSREVATLKGEITALKARIDDLCKK